MAKTSILFSCTSCDAQFQKWTGRCFECGNWGSIKEHYSSESSSSPKTTIPPLEMATLSDISKVNVSRFSTRLPECDRVFGGGIVPGSLTLLGGEPGIGKSTLSLQLATAITPTLYISGEESTEQISLRAKRLQASSNPLKLVNAVNIERICATIIKESPQLVILDSIQTVYSPEASGSSGSPNQIRSCTVQLMSVAKKYNIAIIIIGHVTKDGAVAGPKTLEHLVDTVLYLEGDRHHSYRMLRAVKNRFGSTDELGVFDMTETGLHSVENPSAALLEERGASMPGSVVTCLLEGSRPLLVEVQALLTKTAFGYPQRKASGFDLNRLHVLLAVLEKRAGLSLTQYDVHINVVGGIKANEPGADLAVCLAVASAYKDVSLGNDLVVFGEVGLGGEVRSVTQAEKRLKECAHLGMKRVILGHKKKLTSNDLTIISVKSIPELIKQT